MAKRKKEPNATTPRGTVLQPESEIGRGVTCEVLELFRKQKRISLANDIGPIIEKYKIGRELNDTTAGIIEEEVERAVILAWKEGIATVSIPKFETSRSGSVCLVDMIYKQMKQ